MIPLLMMLSCAPKAPPPVSDATVAGPRTMAESRPSGVVYEGVFTDEMYAFSIPVQEGWVAEAGPETGLMRVSMSHVATSTHVEIWVFPGSGLEPRVREGCTWTFQSKGRPIQAADQTLVATCVPDDALQRRVYGTIFEHGGQTVQLEVQPPNDALLEGRSIAEALLAGLAW